MPSPGGVLRNPAPGTPGATGATGATGAAGTFSSSNWAALTAYIVNQMVIPPAAQGYLGGLVQCSTAHTSTSTYDPTKFTVVIPYTEPLRAVGGTGQPAFASPWVNAGGLQPVQFYKTAAGLVFIEGAPKTASAIGSSTNSPIFTLPSGYTPVATLKNFMVGLTNGASMVPVTISTGGVVSVYSGSGLAQYAFLFLNGISFIPA